MEPAAATSSPPAPAWRGMVRRRSQAWEERDRALRRVEELEVEVVRLRAEKMAAKRAAARLTAELEAEQGAAATAATEAMMMIARLQREKSAAMIEAREFRRVAEIRAARERELEDQLEKARALAASYHALLRAHGIDKDKGVVTEQAAPSSSSSPSAAVQSFEDKYAVDVRWKKPVAEARIEGDLCARVEALEADRVALRRELVALRAERAQLVMAREMARRLCWEMVAEQRAIVKKTAAPAGSFSVFGICKWVFSILLWRNKSSTAKYTFGLSTTFLGLLLLLDRSTMFSPWRRLPRPQR